MASSLHNKRILLGITGSIAAYKSADLARRLREAGAIVRVAMTENAKRFITPMTMQAVSGNPVHDDLFDLEAEAAMGHIELARWADLILVAPASADLMARLTHGNANDLLTTLCLATRAPIALAPAMNQGMWKHTATQANRQVLTERGIYFFGPAEGSQACGDTGPGRMLEPDLIVEHAQRLFHTGLLAGRTVVITAGPTQEAIDPVRYISNHSSGKMGYALAEAARDAGANVVLISGPVALAPPRDMAMINVTTAQEMHQAVMANMTQADIFLAVAAVSDYCSQHIAPQKLKKESKTLTLTLERNIDIVAEVGILPEPPFIVGFAAETEQVIEHARAKRERKHMDMIIANQVGDGIGMGSDENSVTIITAQHEVNLPTMTKTQLAHKIVEHISSEFQKRKIPA